VALGANTDQPTAGAVRLSIPRRRALRGVILMCLYHLAECKIEYNDGKRETLSLSDMRCMLADGLVWAKNPDFSGNVEWLPGQRYRHNTLCRHELGRRVAGFACVRLFPSGQIIWVPNKPHSLLPFEENLERLGNPTTVRIGFPCLYLNSFQDLISCPSAGCNAGDSRSSTCAGNAGVLPS
jgi:hypothetical protein